MIDPGFELIPLRTYEWLLDLVDQRTTSPIYDKFKTVEKREVAPMAAELEEAVHLFPALVVLYSGWELGNPAQMAAMDNVEGEHRIDLALFNAVPVDGDVGLEIRRLTALVAKLWLQSPKLLSPRDPNDPTDLTKSLWRPVDSQATGFSMHKFFCRRVILSDPLPVSDGLLIEQSRIELIATGGARDV